MPRKTTMQKNRRRGEEITREFARNKNKSKLKHLHLPEFAEQKHIMERQQGVDEVPDDGYDLNKSDESFGNITIKKQKIPLK